MQYCQKCGKELKDGAFFCVNCGFQVRSKNAAPSFVQEDIKRKPRTATILGIFGIAFAWLFALVGHIVSIIGIVVGIKEYKHADNLTGLVLSIVGEVCAIFSSIIGAIAMSGLF